MSLHENARHEPARPWRVPSHRLSSGIVVVSSNRSRRMKPGARGRQTTSRCDMKFLPRVSQRRKFAEDLQCPTRDAPHFRKGHYARDDDDDGIRRNHASTTRWVPRCHFSCDGCRKSDLNVRAKYQ